MVLEAEASAEQVLVVVPVVEEVDVLSDQTEDLKQAESAQLLPFLKACNYETSN